MWNWEEVRAGGERSRPPLCSWTGRAEASRALKRWHTLFLASFPLFISILWWGNCQRSRDLSVLESKKVVSNFGGLVLVLDAEWGRWFSSSLRNIWTSLCFPFCCHFLFFCFLFCFFWFTITSLIELCRGMTTARLMTITNQFLLFSLLISVSLW